MKQDGDPELVLLVSTHPQYSSSSKGKRRRELSSFRDWNKNERGKLLGALFTAVLSTSRKLS
jgi:hypothetical protein